MIRTGILVFFLLVHGTTAAQNYIFAELQGQPLMNTTGWTLTGAAGIGDTNGDVDTFSNELILTHNVNNSSGGIFFDQALDLAVCARWIASFEFRIWDGNAADGIAFCFLDVPPTGFVAGGGIGIPATANGLKVVFDTYDNGCGPNPEVQIYSGPGYDECFPSLAKINNVGGSLNFIRSNGYNQAEIRYDSGFVDVYLNGNLMMGGIFAPAAFTGYVGFTSGTGAQNDRHSIRNVLIYTDGSSLSGFLSIDTSSRWPVVQANCYGDTLRLNTIGQFRCSSVDPGGSEFRLYNEQGSLMQVKAVHMQCVNDRSDEMLIELGQPFLRNGRYYLVLRNGIDGNAIEGDCGASLLPFDSVLVEVNNCYLYDRPVNMRNVSVLPDNQMLSLHWEMPSVDSAFFNGYRLQRNTSAGNTNWSDVAWIGQLYDTSFTYNQMNPSTEQVDFRVILRVKYNPDCQAGDSVANILLENPDQQLYNAEAKQATLKWTPYEQAWSNPIYYLVMTNPQNDSVLIGPLADEDYLLDMPLLAGNYKIYVRTEAPDGRYARSNELSFEIPERLPEVFNVITPNGDGLNDFLTINGILFFPEAVVKLFNRWGQNVFTATNYQNNWSPTSLESGNYVYELQLPDGSILRGMLRIMK
jgi:gliding motility-associated-like protein